MKTIPLTQGKVAIVDDDMFEELSKHKWYFSCGYVIRNRAGGCIGRKKILMHSEIIKTPAASCIKYANRNKLDNRKENLIARTRADSEHNKNKQRNNTSGFKGVSWAKWRLKWRSTIDVNKKRVYLGYFDDKQAAALAYDDAARKYFGDFAKTNFESRHETAQGE